jgi:glycosyltransferase involved in cell wall biosynthesis
MRILVFHAYLLHGTGSNVYNSELAAALVRLGHEVHLLAQEPDPGELPFVDAVGTWQDGRLEVRELRSPVRCTVYRPDIGGLLPVYVLDRYAGIEARRFTDLSAPELDDYLERNVAAVRDVAERASPGAALANHLVMGPVIVARAIGERVPYAIKIHGSALEYTVKPEPDRFLPYAREGLERARGVLVGSGHTARSLWSALGDPALPDRTRLGPPGVDVRRFTPRPVADATAGVKRLAQRLRDLPAKHGDEGSSFDRDPAVAAAALDELQPDGERLVAFVGKLILAKGIDLLLAAWPLVLARVPSARLVVVGFGAFAERAQALVADLAAGRIEALDTLAAEGRAAEGGDRSKLEYLAAFARSLTGGERERYIHAASALAQRVTFTGRLEHGELPELLPACEALVVPSTFPEAFGMVAAEAAACGVLPVSARHSGLAEVAGVLAEGIPPEARGLLGFDLGADAVRELAARLCRWIDAPAALREATRKGLVAVARERYSWEGVGRGVLAAAAGRLDELPPPPSEARIEFAPDR